MIKKKKKKPGALYRRRNCIKLFTKDFLRSLGHRFIFFLMFQCDSRLRLTMFIMSGRYKMVNIYDPSCMVMSRISFLRVETFSKKFSFDYWVFFPFSLPFFFSMSYGTVIDPKFNKICFIAKQFNEF